ncbi:MAG: rhodanese-like domain-containing protein [Acidobacteriota bacterium]|nr:MAG: rhodanese-like domain-containing protein [Acidobacteriota bacterium]
MRLASLSLLLMVVGCESSLSWESVDEMVRRDFPGVEHVSAEELNRSLESGAAPVLLDVREEAEYNVSHLPGAVRVQPGSDTSELIETLEPDTPIVAYCSVGYRSSELVQKLTERGFTNVKNLDGSIFAWANGGYPVERDGEEVHEVHPFDEVWGTLLHEDLRAYEPGVK